MNLKENMKRFGTKNLSEQIFGDRLDKVDAKDIEKYKQNHIANVLGRILIGYIDVAAKATEKEIKNADMKLPNGLSITPDELDKYIRMAQKEQLLNQSVKK